LSAGLKKIFVATAAVILVQLRAAGHDPKSLHAILLTHSHWDHVSGLPDFPGVPVWVTPQEHEFIRKSGDMDFCRLFAGIPYEVYGFEGGPYLGFPASHDVYGDGSIVVVPAPSHTSGSVIIFVTLSSGTRYAFVGDLVYQLHGVTQREECPGSSAEEPIRMLRATVQTCCG
jgi:glyoxylase-like metal-dependent hydrolase (beta-lactamase superfamily II)